MVRVIGENRLLEVGNMIPRLSIWEGRDLLQFCVEPSDLSTGDSEAK
jgi:hypothetical protein